jgi:1-acyl-sn-glycerol-3-phosphate acyltransferase
MRLIRLIGKKLWGSWVAFIFTFYYLSIFPFQWLVLQFPSRFSFKTCHYLNTSWAKFVLTLGLSRLRYTQAAELSKSQCYVFVSNHRSYIDIPIGHLALFPLTFKYIAKAELAKVPLFGYMYRKNHIMLNRGDKSDRAKSLQAAHDALQLGFNLFIFPEGTTRHTQNLQLGPIRDGAFILAIQNQVPVVPISIINSDQALSNEGKFKVKPFVKIHVYIDAPIETKGMTMDDLPILRDKVVLTINQHMEKGL